MGPEVNSEDCWTYSEVTADSPWQVKTWFKQDNIQPETQERHIIDPFTIVVSSGTTSFFRSNFIHLALKNSSNDEMEPKKLYIQTVFED